MVMFTERYSTTVDIQGKHSICTFTSLKEYLKYFQRDFFGNSFDFFHEIG